MPYDPYAPTQRELARIHLVLAFALAPASLALTIYVVAGPVQWVRIPLGALGIFMLYPVVPSRYLDEYTRALLHVAAGWAASVWGAWLAIHGLRGLGTVAHSAGYRAGGGSGQPSAGVEVLPTWFDDIYLVALLSAFAFFAGFNVARWRGTE